MDLGNTMIIFLTLSELLLLAVTVTFFLRLRKSEVLVSNLQAKQEEFINRLHFNAQLEHELVGTFEHRQQELVAVNDQLEERAKELHQLIEKAQEFSKSPQFLRQMVMDGHRNGRSYASLAKINGLGIDEVELIVDQA